MTEHVGDSGFAGLFEEHREALWGLCYRMTGSAADADDLVQDTFARAMERPPADLERPWRPWLVRVAMNLSRDLLRQRRRRSYPGSWLPEPVDLEAQDWRGLWGAAGRYGRLESATVAFLVALEELTPQQRAVLLLRDVLDYSTQESAAALSMGASNVKTTLHRARRRMEEYDHRRCPPTLDIHDQTQMMLRRFLAAMASGDHQAMAALLADDARVTGDSGGEYWTVRKPLRGRDRVVAFFQGLSRKYYQQSPPFAFAEREYNGLPALVAAVKPIHPRQAPLGILQCVLDREGRIGEIYSITAPDKLGGVKRP